MTKTQFQKIVNDMLKTGITINDIAKKTGYSNSSITRAKSNKWNGDSSKVYSKFELVYSLTESRKGQSVARIINLKFKNKWTLTK